jgi:PKD repeat protein
VANGSQTQTHTYAAAGAYTVSVTASAGSTSRTSTRTISIGTGGPPLPSTQYTLAGAEFEPLTGGWRGNAGSVIAFAATEPDPLATFAWNFGDGSTGTGRAVSHVWTSDGVKTVTLTVTGGGTQTAGTNIGTIRLSLAEPDFRALMIPGAGSILSAAGDWATDLSITNPGTQSMVITLYFASFSDQIPADLSTLPFDTLDSFPLGGGESWSGVDVVGSPEILNRRGAGKGILFARFEGGNELPIATTRVYFTSQGSSFGTALPSVLTGPFGQTTAQQIEATTAQTLVGLRNDPLYRFNVSLFNASSQGGLFHVDIFSEDGAQVASEDFAVPPYSQAGVNDTDLFTPDPSKRYVLKATGTSGKLQAYASVLDRRNNDLVQVADETPRVAAAAGAPVSYYISGVGRIEIPETNTHWRTDLSFYNPSESARPVILEYHYTPTGSTTEKVVLTRITIETGQLVTADDIVGNDAFLDGATEEDLKTGSILGLLKVSYNVPLDGAPLIIGGRIYADLSTGTAGMQLSTYTADASVAPGSSSTLVMPGAQTNLRFRTNIGIFTQGDEPTPVQIKAIKQDGTEAATFNYTLNDLGHTGAFAQIPITPDTFPGIDGNAMTIKVKALSGSPVGAYIVTVDQISTDTVFIQGKRVN